MVKQNLLKVVSLWPFFFFLLFFLLSVCYSLTCRIIKKNLVGYWGGTDKWTEKEGRKWEEGGADGI